MRKARGSRTSARPIATRWRWPPESAAGLRSISSPRPSIAAIRSTRSVISGLGTLRRRSPKARFSRTVLWGYSA